MRQGPSYGNKSKMSSTNSMWDLAPCIEFALACRRSHEEAVSNYGLRPAFESSLAANVDMARLNKVLYDIRKSTGKFNAANEPSKVRLHGFARKSTMGLRGEALGEEEDIEPKRSTVDRTNTLGGAFSPIIKAVTPPAPSSISHEDLCSLDDGYSSSNSSPKPIYTPPTSDSEGETYDEAHIPAHPKEAIGEISSAQRQHVVAVRTAKKAAKKAIAEKHITSTSVAEVLPIQPAEHGRKKVQHSHQLDAQHFVAEYLANARSQRNKKNKKVKIVEPPRDVVAISTKTIAPVVSHAKAEAAKFAVANAQKAHAQQTSKKTTQLTPSSVVVSTKSVISPIRHDLPNHPYSSAQIQKHIIAGKFVRRHHLAGTPEASQIMSAVANVSDNYSEDGIHVFIDGSNINIGFMDALKEASGIHKYTKCNGNGALFFEPLAFLLERGRKVAQKELVGSVRENEEMAPYMAEAVDCGYEVSAPQIVRKMKTLHVQGLNNEADSDWTGKPAWVNRPVKKMAYTEQLVDELIHLKMATAILEYKPSTMVLATGDANVAEYSGGFAKYVNLALDKGWKVEIIAWKHGISNVYKKMKKANDLSESFKIIELDDYRTELTNEAKPSDWWAKASA